MGNSTILAQRTLTTLKALLALVLVVGGITLWSTQFAYAGGPKTITVDMRNVPTGDVDVVYVDNNQYEVRYVGAPQDNTVNIEDGDILSFVGDNSIQTIDNKPIKIDGGNVDLTKSLKVEFKDLNVTSTSVSPFRLTGKAEVDVTLRGNNIFALTDDTTDACIRVDQGSTLTISDGGSGASLSATSKGFGAGIGSAQDTMGGTIIIEGGTIEAYGCEGYSTSTPNREVTTSYAAGIGAGQASATSETSGIEKIVICGGAVTARSSKEYMGYAAGIGSGYALEGKSTCGSITISNDISDTTSKTKVTAVSGASSHVLETIGAGIGSGGSSESNATSSCSEITIEGSATEVTAYSSDDTYGKPAWGAGIGGGMDSSAGTITIDGATVIAASSANSEGRGAGIGAGWSYAKKAEDSNSSITIKDGKIKAYSGVSATCKGAGIGGGGGVVSDGFTQILDIKIEGGTIAANSNAGNQGTGVGAGIGAGYSEQYPTIPQIVNITISGGIIDTSTDAQSTSYGAGIGAGCKTNNATINTTITGGTIRALSDEGSGIGQGKDTVDCSISTKISGGSIYAEGKDSRIDPQATAADGATPVFFTELQFEGITQPTKLSPTFGSRNLNGYGVNDVVTDDHGKVFFWLPAGTYTKPALAIGDIDPTTYRADELEVVSTSPKSYVLLSPASHNSFTVKAGSGGSVSGSQSGTYEQDTSLAVLAVPNEGYTFSGWTAEGIVLLPHSMNPASFDMPGNKVTLTANFELVPPTVMPKVGDATPIIVMLLIAFGVLTVLMLYCAQRMRKVVLTERRHR